VCREHALEFIWAFVVVFKHQLRFVEHIIPEVLVVLNTHCRNDPLIEAIGTALWSSVVEVVREAREGGGGEREREREGERGGE
jgi:hypothetical protein